MAQSVKQQILSRIYGRGRGWVFTPSDFIQDFKRWEISNSLEDLANQGIIRRLARGIYDYPLYSELLKKNVAPDMTRVAAAIARKFSWRILPSGETALNYLGLSTQIVGYYLYLSDGPTKKYDILGQNLSFRHTTLREASISDKNTILVVQALKAVGENNITDEFLEKLRLKFSRDEWMKIKKYSSKSILWIQNIINSIIENLG